jgi:transcriptional antiterminator NusG
VVGSSAALLVADAPPVAPLAEAGAASPWFAVWTRSRHEAIVHQQLEAKGLPAFLPTMGRWSRWKDRRKRVEFPLFPGYCFVRVEPADALRVRSCAGVVGLVGIDGRPVPIAEHEIESIRTLIETDLRFDPCPFIRAGDLVEVVRGPLRGVVGRLVRKGTRSRLVLSVGLIAQGVTVDVDAADVRRY